MLTENQLIEKGFKVVGTKSNGLKVYARIMEIDEGAIVLHKVNTEGESLGVEFFEVETLKILKDSGLL